MLPGRYDDDDDDILMNFDLCLYIDLQPSYNF